MCSRILGISNFLAILETFLIVTTLLLLQTRGGIFNSGLGANLGIKNSRSAIPLTLEAIIIVT